MFSCMGGTRGGSDAGADALEAGDDDASLPRAPVHQRVERIQEGKDCARISCGARADSG